MTSRRGSRSETILLVLAAIAVATAAAAWIASPDQPTAFASAMVPKNPYIMRFEDRFAWAPNVAADKTALRPLDRSVLSAVERKLGEAKGQLAQELQSGGWRTAPLGEPAPVATTDIPLPRSRPAEAGAEPRGIQVTARAESASPSDNRTLLEKISELWPSKITLASLAPDGGLFRSGPDLGALGYEPQTAVYDISARAVYMPGGAKLEAHSGLGDLMDDPEHVHEPNVGATPPAVYDLKPRERLFHGVRALRMIPVDGTTYGRSGLLAHSYLLGPNGESNGCVSIRNYEKFLQAFSSGEIRRLVVVPSLNTTESTLRSSSQS